MEKISLFKIDEQILKLISLDESDIIDSETGEVLIDITEELEKLNIKREDKIINIARYIDDLDREKNLIKEKIAVLTSRAKSKEKRVESLKAYLMDSMIKLGTNKIEDETVTVRLNSSKSVNPVNVELIPTEYISQKVEIKPDLRKIGAAIKNGLVIPGAELVEKYSVTVR